VIAGKRIEMVVGESGVALSYPHRDFGMASTITVTTDNNSVDIAPNSNMLVGRASGPAMAKAQSDYINGLYGPVIIKMVISYHEPLIPGTSIPVYQISSLVEGGMKIRGILKDYPSLNEDQVSYAVAFAKVVPNRHRQYPKTTFKQLLRKLNLHDLLSE
jgi:uncharacterized protein (DUF433 family)